MTANRPASSRLAVRLVGLAKGYVLAECVSTGTALGARAVKPANISCLREDTPVRHVRIDSFGGRFIRFFNGKQFFAFFPVRKPAKLRTRIIRLNFVLKFMVQIVSKFMARIAVNQTEHAFAEQQ